VRQRRREGQTLSGATWRQETPKAWLAVDSDQGPFDGRHRSFLERVAAAAPALQAGGFGHRDRVLEIARGGKENRAAAHGWAAGVDRQPHGVVAVHGGGGRVFPRRCWFPEVVHWDKPRRQHARCHSGRAVRRGDWRMRGHFACRCPAATRTIVCVALQGHRNQHQSRCDQPRPPPQHDGSHACGHRLGVGLSWACKKKKVAVGERGGRPVRSALGAPHGWCEWLCGMQA